VGWIHLTLDIDQQWALVNMVINTGLHKMWEISRFSKAVNIKMAVF
jgi:hypothetical protein